MAITLPVIGSTPWGDTLNLALAGLQNQISGFVALLGTTYSAKDYGALADDTADDTTSIQNAINDAVSHGGGVVYFPPGVYKITAALNVASNVTMRGAGSEVSIIHQTGTAANGVVGNNVRGVDIENLGVKGPGKGVGTGHGIVMTYAGTEPTTWTPGQPTVPYYLTFKNVQVSEWGQDGVRLQTPIVSHFDRVVSHDNGAHGFNLYEAGTSCTFTSCWARNNALYGFKLFRTIYSAFHGCAADFNQVSYYVQESQSISFVGCGSEKTTITGTDPHKGASWVFDGSNTCSLVSVEVIENPAVGIKFINGAWQCSVIGAAENNGTVTTGTVFIHADANTSLTLCDIRNDHPNDFAVGSRILVLNDGNGSSVVPVDLDVKHDLHVRGDFYPHGGVSVIRTAQYDAGLVSESATSDSYVLTGKVTNDLGPRVWMQADGRIIYGDGTGTNDVQVWRSAASTLRTTANLLVDGSIEAGTYIKPPVISAPMVRPNAATLGAGAMIYDFDHKMPLWSDGTVWLDAMGGAAP